MPSPQFLIRWISFCLFLLVPSVSGAQPVLDLNQQPALTAGEYSNYFQESGEPLSLSQAITQFKTYPVNLGTSQSISLGISVAPVWLKVRLHTDGEAGKSYRFSTETPWLDHIDAWLVHEGRVIEHVVGGDALPYAQRPMQYRYFAFETELPAGETQLYLRVDTLGPMAIPLRISESTRAIQRDISSSYQYGFLYGIMIALALYNLMIYLGIRHSEYGLYALYLLGFVINSLSYTGQLHTWFTPDWGPYFQDWLDIFLMITYSIAGLHFARILLKTRQYAPTLDRITIGVTVFIPAGMLIGALLNNLTLSLLLAFILNTSFAVLFIILGIQAIRHQVATARLFVICSVTAATCICISTAAVAGLLPYNDVTFKLIEVGMAFESICLAFLLAQRFRLTETEKRVALHTARVDPLTGLNNRRGFEHAAYPLWHQQLRSKRDVSVILMDIDHFKKINDRYGHTLGDEVLRSVASLLTHSARRSDIIARWGGEEFLILLPDTNKEQARKHAEQLRRLIESSKIDSDKGEIHFTASFGVSGSAPAALRQNDSFGDGLDDLINAADNALYQVKETGRNQVQLGNATG
ncbi:diguanylate cyclase [Lacimicrobium sp. SS2-24]|uniref:diguanylate cyclase n=1 Tax=Lacimicrobium sp. SS2-24 TaxID=2005569 RepID=UPI000B4B8496|nr:diguanylate cyclase [Lacimicrobium sp. SS2-24]